MKSLKTKKIGNKTIIFSFFDEYIADTTNIMVVIGKKTIFVCDTFLGPESISQIQQYLEKNCPELLKNKNVVVFNSHSDWDHIWGNCSEWFTDSQIISQYNCYLSQKRDATSTLVKLSKYKRGNVEIKLPNLIFTTKLDFPDEKVSFFHTPGHTEGSASCYLEEEKILFVGDNLEEPLPYIYYYNEGFKDYISSLEKYLSLDVDNIVPGHGKIAGKELIQNNLSYIKNLSLREIKIDEMDINQQKNHLSNLNSLYSYALAKNNKKISLEFLEMLSMDIENATIDIPQKEKQIEIIREKINEFKSQN